MKAREALSRERDLDEAAGEQRAGRAGDADHDFLSRHGAGVYPLTKVSGTCQRFLARPVKPVTAGRSRDLRSSASKTL